jgi:hypothetical protein
MRVDDLDVRNLRSRQRLQAVDDIELHFAGDHQFVLEQEVVVAMNGAADRIFERHDAVRCALLDDRFEDVVERLARHRLDLRATVEQRSGFAVGARLSLIRESH